MGFLDRLFGKKMMCDQCGKRFPVKTTHHRRSMDFCSEECLGDWLQEHPLPDVSGQSRDEHKALALAALEKANAFIVTANALQTRKLGQTVEEASAATHAARNAFFEYELLRDKALPYLYALGLENEALELERLNLSWIRDIKDLGGGVPQQAKVNKAFKPLSLKLHALTKSVQSA